MNLLRPEREELAVIGIAVSGKALDLSPLLRLTSDDFCSTRTQMLFEGVQGLMLQQKQISIPALDEALSRKHGSETVKEVMAEALNAAAENALNAWNLPGYVQIISEAAQRRRLIKVGEALSRAAADERRDVSEVLDAAHTALQKNTRNGGKIVKMTDACLDAYDAAFNQRKPISTGIGELDSILCGGLHRGELTILGARPSVGKSSVLLEMARCAAREGNRVLFATLEMSTLQLGFRTLAANSGLNAGILRAGMVKTDEDLQSLADGLTETGLDGSENISILDISGSMTVEELSQAVHSGEYDLLLVDYIQLLRTRRKTGSDLERLGIVSRTLKEITLTTNIPVVAAAQVRRQNNGGTLRAPGLDELRGSGDLEQDADNVLLLHRIENADDYVLRSPGYLARHDGLFEGAQMRKLQLLTIDVAKQRQGKTSRAWVMFNPSRMRFYDPGVRSS
ncbi:MAG: hypothetical protein IKA47_08325 [Oscillospiraceae bacterium]|nr:hypothetical protein [Oscillospiraceae bacterium]